MPSELPGGLGQGTTQSTDRGHHGPRQCKSRLECRQDVPFAQQAERGGGVQAERGVAEGFLELPPEPFPADAPKRAIAYRGCQARARGSGQLEAQPRRQPRGPQRSGRIVMEAAVVEDLKMAFPEVRQRAGYGLHRHSLYPLGRGKRHRQRVDPKVPTREIFS